MVSILYYIVLKCLQSLLIWISLTLRQLVHLGKECTTTHYFSSNNYVIFVRATKSSDVKAKVVSYHIWH